MGVLGGHKAIDYIIKRGKRSCHSHVMGKAIPKMGPTVADTSFTEFSTGLTFMFNQSISSGIRFQLNGN